MLQPTSTPPPLGQIAATAQAWSMVHGYAMLLPDGRLDATPHLLSQREQADADVLLRAGLGMAPSQRTPRRGDRGFSRLRLRHTLLTFLTGWSRR